MNLRLLTTGCFALSIMLFDVPTQAAELVTSEGQPICSVPSKLADYLTALTLRDVRAIRELRDSCVSLKAGFKVKVIEDDGPNGNGDLRFVKVLLATKRGPLNGYTVFAGLHDEREQHAAQIIKRSKWIKDGPGMGCWDYNDWLSLVDLTRKGDKEAWGTFAQSRCSIIVDGSVGEVTDYKFLSFDEVNSENVPTTYDVCIQFTGKGRCLWVTNALVKKWSRDSR